VRSLAVVLLFLVVAPAWAITPKEVVDSSLKHYPQVIEAFLNVQEKDGDLREAEGAFDARLRGEVDAKTDGFYDGDYYSGQIEKAFPFLGSKVYGGYRNSVGEFPVYEGKYDSSTQGQRFAGVSLSLLRNSLIDINRYKVRMAEQNKIQSELQLERLKIAVQTLSLQAYWTWVVKGHELKVYQEILDLAQERMKQINRRIKMGDLARIFQQENNQYIQRRQARVLQGQLEFQKAAYYLSLFYRDNKGKMITLSQTHLPGLETKKLERISTYAEVLKVATDLNLDLKTLSSQVMQAEAEINMGVNEILPRIDVSFEVGQNRGLGANRTSEDEARVMLNIEVPIQYERGLGRRQSGRSKLAQVKTQQGFVRDKIKAESQTLTLEVNSFAEIFDVTKNEVELARTLAKAEMRKFQRGASDLILVNIREENLAEAQIKNLKSLLDYQLTSAEIRRLKVEFL